MSTAVIVALMSVSWIVSGACGGWILYCRFQAAFPDIADEHRDMDKGFATIISIAGPAAMLFAVLCTIIDFPTVRGLK